MDIPSVPVAAEKISRTRSTVLAVGIMVMDMVPKNINAMDAVGSQVFNTMKLVRNIALDP
jgi:hypothetical protein